MKTWKSPQIKSLSLLNTETDEVYCPGDPDSLQKNGHQQCSYLCGAHQRSCGTNFRNICPMGKGQAWDNIPHCGCKDSQLS